MQRKSSHASQCPQISSQRQIPLVKHMDIDVAEINGRLHIICVDYFTCCIFERELRSLHSVDVIDALKSIFCDIGAPDRDY